MLGCYYLSLSGWAFGYTQLIPMFFMVVMAVVKMLTYNCIWFIYGLWLYLPQFILWVFQRYFQYVRPDPICSLYQSFAFPSIEAFYIGIIVGLFVVWTIVYEVDQSWFVWVCVYTFGLVFPGILIFTTYNVWWETMFSALFGFFISWMFVIVVKQFMQPYINYLLHAFPLWHFGYHSEWMDIDEFKRIDEGLRKLDGRPLL